MSTKDETEDLANSLGQISDATQEVNINATIFAKADKIVCLEIVLIIW